MNHSEESWYKVEGLPVEPKPSKACAWRFTEKIKYHTVIGSMAGNCIWCRPTAGFAEQNGRDAERAAAQNEQLINIFRVLQDLN